MKRKVAKTQQKAKTDESYLCNQKVRKTNIYLWKYVDIGISKTR